MSETTAGNAKEPGIYVSVHLVNDTTYNTQKKYIEAIIFKLFSDRYYLEYEDPDHSPERELIFKLKKPAASNNEENKNFFINLEAFFTKTQRYLPSFTQGLETHK